jgi:putative FmdB family regulatory protein
VFFDSNADLVRYPQIEMPIYEYQCRKCAHEFELLILKGSPAPACPACQSEEIEQLLSGFAVTSAGISKSRLQTARRKLAGSSQVKDQKVAEAEYFKKEREEHGGG